MPSKAVQIVRSREQSQEDRKRNDVRDRRVNARPAWGTPGWAFPHLVWTHPILAMRSRILPSSSFCGLDFNAASNSFLAEALSPFCINAIA